MPLLTDLVAMSAALTLNVPYKNPATYPTLDVYRPANCSAPCPVVIVLPGGGWATSDRLDNAGPLHSTVIKGLITSGIAVANVSYRTSAETAFPGQIHDIKYAVRWLRRNGSVLGLNPDRTGIYGASAGGHLALLVGLTAGTGELDYPPQYPHDAVSNAIKAIAAASAPAELSMWDSDTIGLGYQLYNSVGWMHPTSVLWPMLGTAPGSPASPQLLVDASPASYVDLATGRPILLQAGLTDAVVPDTQSWRFAGELARASALVECESVPAGHNDGAFLLPASVARVVGFFLRTL